MNDTDYMKPITRKEHRRALHQWCVIVGFLCFTAGVLAGMGIVWVNDHWVPWEF